MVAFLQAEGGDSHFQSNRSFPPGSSLSGGSKTQSAGISIDEYEDIGQYAEFLSYLEQILMRPRNRSSDCP
jgi:hypothetical protein